MAPRAQCVLLRNFQLPGGHFVTVVALKLHLGGKAEKEIVGSNDSFQGNSLE